MTGAIVNCQLLPCSGWSRGPAGCQSRLAAIGVVHIAVVALTWRDIRNRPAEQIRSSKKFWLVLSALNAANAAAYWLVGRRRA
jgi:hypothetical protein